MTNRAVRREQRRILRALGRRYAAEGRRVPTLVTRCLSPWGWAALTQGRMDWVRDIVWVQVKPHLAAGLSIHEAVQRVAADG